MTEPRRPSITVDPLMTDASDRPLDVEAARKCIWGYVDASSDEGIIIDVPAMDAVMTDLIAHLWDAISEVGRLRARVAGLEAERAEMVRAFTDPDLLAAYQATAESTARMLADPEKVAWLREQRARLDARLAAAPPRPSITCDPRVGFGRPCVTGTGTHAEVVAEHVWAGESPDEVTRDFDIHRLDVLWCCAWWVDGQLRSRPRQRERWQLWRKWATHAGLVLGGHRPGVELCDPDDYKP